MPSWNHVFTRAADSAVLGTATSVLALAMAARAEGHGALQPLNATSHWLNGEAAAEHTEADLQHTGVGLATHAAATFFWAVIFERWFRKPGGSRVEEAAALAAVAAFVDYVPTPKRFTPGWEFVLSPPAMGVAYVAMAVGFLLRHDRHTG